MHVFITGVGGFAGGWLARDFLRRGWRITGLTRNPAARAAEIDNAGFATIVSDAANLDELPADVDAVVHAAATMPFGGASMDKLLHDNVLATRRLIELSLQRKVKSFVLFSSTSVFGREHTGVLDDSSAAVDPEEYGLTKALCERLLADAADHLPSIALRLPAVIGPGAGRNWVAATAARILAGQELTIFNAKEPFNNCVHIADVARLIADLIEQGFVGMEAAILSAAGTVSIRETVDILMEGLGRTVLVREVAPTRQPFTVACDKAKKLWNWQSMTTSQSLVRYAAEERQFVAIRSKKGQAGDAIRLG